MARFLLVHGAAHGAWCWRDVLPALRALGHEAKAIDLPSHGHDPTPPETVTLDDYAQAILAALEPDTILIGHSMGGYPITRAAEIDATRVARLTYLCAYTPWPDMSLARMRFEAPSQPLLPAIRLAADEKTFTFDPARAPGIFYHDCPEGTADYALPRLTPQPVAPNGTAIALDHSPALPRSYILCEEDRAIPPEFQQTMAERFAPGDRHRLPCGHSPFFAMPDRLAALLGAIARA